MEKRVVPLAGDRKTLSVLFWLFAAAGLLVFAVVTIPPGIGRSTVLEDNLLRARALRDGLALKEQALFQYERSLKSDPFFNEAMLRGKMKYRRSGETEVRTEGEAAPLFAVATMQVPDFAPVGHRSSTLEADVANWALLVASALLLASAFLFFDRPALPRLRHITLPGRA